MPVAEERGEGGKNTDEQDEKVNIDRAGHVKGGQASNNGVDGGEEDDDDQMPELLDLDVEEESVSGVNMLFEYYVLTQGRIDRVA